QISPTSIEFINPQQPIEVESESYINLTNTKSLSEDLHIIMPDKLIRIIYASSLQLKLNDALARLDPNNFPQSIFKMPTSLMNNWNQWAKVKSLENWCLKSAEDCFPQNS